MKHRLLWGLRGTGLDRRVWSIGHTSSVGVDVGSRSPVCVRHVDACSQCTSKINGRHSHVATKSNGSLGIPCQLAGQVKVNRLYVHSPQCVLKLLNEHPAPTKEKFPPFEGLPSSVGENLARPWQLWLNPADTCRLEGASSTQGDTLLAASASLSHGGRRLSFEGRPPQSEHTCPGLGQRRKDHHALHAEGG